MSRLQKKGCESHRIATPLRHTASRHKDTSGRTAASPSTTDTAQTKSAESAKTAAVTTNIKSPKGPFMVLAGALASSAAFGFPVFCLICPVGLTFALVIALWRLAEFNELSWSIAIFAGFLFLEVFVLRRWCRSFCPLGAVMTLLSWGNRTFRIRSTPMPVFARPVCPAKSAAQSAQRDLIPLRLKQQTSHRHAAPNVESALTLALHKHCNSLFHPLIIRYRHPLKPSTSAARRSRNANPCSGATAPTKL